MHVQVGDASSASSPISFGGFGAMLRHLERLTDGIDQALMQDRLSRQSLALLQVLCYWDWFLLSLLCPHLPFRGNAYPFYCALFVCEASAAGRESSMA